MKRITFGACWTVGLSLGLLTSSTLAREQSETEVRAVVLSWVKYCTVDAKPDAVIQRITPHLRDGKAGAYIVEFADGGYCLAATDDLLLPVYLYTTRGSFNATQGRWQPLLDEVASAGPRLAKLMSEKASQTSDLRAQAAERADLWKNLIAGVKPGVPATTTKGVTPPPSAPVVMELPLTSIWDQPAPWNAQVPIHPIANQHTVVGCNGIAQAQIMYYWKWPPAGTGTASSSYAYRWRTTWDQVYLNQHPTVTIPQSWSGRLTYDGNYLSMNGNWDTDRFDSALNLSANAQYQSSLTTLWNRLNQGTVTSNVNFSVGYDWSLMTDRLPASAAANAEVAKLCAHAAISSHSDFGLDGTGSSFANWTLAANFYYDPDIIFYPSNMLAVKNSLFTEEIQWLRPVALGGSNPNRGGHAYVVYGYDRTNPSYPKFLINFGWGNDADAHTWIVLDDTAYFYQNQDHLIRVAPAGAVRFVGATVSGDGSPGNPYWNIEEALQNAPNGTKLIFKSGTLNSFSATHITINRPLKLRGNYAMINK